jgi:3-oxoacyl-[acyl-carrier protein] reductase
MSELEGKVALITGASRGIGAATAREFANQGAAVVLAARSGGEIETIAAEIRDGGGKATAVTCDVANYDQVAAAVEACRSEFGQLDILINNAGVVEPIARLGDSDPQAWAEVADINYKGVYFGIHAALPGMLSQGGGIIINISSGAASSPLEGWSHYCSTKAAVLMLTRCTDLEYRDQGIRVLGLSPGTIATGMQIAIKASGLNPISQMDPSAHAQPDWPARTLAWMCSAEAAEFDGGDVNLRDDAIRRRVGLIA